jgi:hypothetical protein
MCGLLSTARVGLRLRLLSSHTKYRGGRLGKSMEHLSLPMVEACWVAAVCVMFVIIIYSRVLSVIVNGSAVLVSILRFVYERTICRVAGNQILENEKNGRYGSFPLFSLVVRGLFTNKKNIGTHGWVDMATDFVPHITYGRSCGNVSASPVVVSVRRVNVRRGGVT